MVQKVNFNVLTGDSLTIGNTVIDGTGVTVNDEPLSGGTGGAEVYANSSLFPLTGLTPGSFAFANNNNTLYLTNGSGWYKIALINQTPSITANLSAVSLGADGNTALVGYTVSEPEGTPVTVSVSNSGIANTSQGNVVLYTSNNTIQINNFAAEGSEWSANITLTVSDGVNLGTTSFAVEVVYSGPIYKISSTSHTNGTQETPNYSWGSTNMLNGCISSDGTRYYRPTFGGNVLQQWNLSTPYDVSTLSSATGMNLTNASGIHMTTDGDHFVVTDRTNIYCYPTSSAQNIANPGSGSAVSCKTLSGETTSVNACGISDDGLHIWFCFQNTNTAYFADLTTAWDVSTATNVTGRQLATSGNILGSHIDRSGRVIHHCDFSNNFSVLSLKQYVSPTAWSWSESEATIQSSTTSHNFTYPSGGGTTTWQYPMPMFCPENPTGINVIIAAYASTDVVSYAATLAEV